MGSSMKLTPGEPEKLPVGLWGYPSASLPQLLRKAAYKSQDYCVYTVIGSSMKLTPGGPKQLPVGLHAMQAAVAINIPAPTPAGSV